MSRVDATVLAVHGGLVALLGLVHAVSTQATPSLVLAGVGGLVCLMGLYFVGDEVRQARRRLAAALHASNTWHCGCVTCVAEAARRRGDVQRKVIRGPWPVRVETWTPSKDEWQRLKGDE